ncbi:putative cardioacceleratory peptide receptor-like, partial [Homarus americanus]
YPSTSTRFLPKQGKSGARQKQPSRTPQRIPVVDWVVRQVFPCLECAQQPVENRGAFHRYGTEYTTVSDASSRRHTLTSV